jgi:hypothetical protein
MNVKALKIQSFCVSATARVTREGNEFGSKMDGSAPGTISRHDRRSGRFLAGNTEYRAKQQRIVEKVRQLNLDYDPSPSQRMLLPIIARHLDDAERARSAERRFKASNTANRLLRSIPRRKRKKQLAVPSLQELEAIGGGT